MRNTKSSHVTKLLKYSVGAAVCAAATVVAYAAVTFDPATGLGFVGKGDLQTPWGWNDAKLQNSAAGVSFYYHTYQTGSYSAVCTFTTGEGTRGERTHNVAHSKDVVGSIESTVLHDARKNSQGKVTGFNLTGLGTGTSTVSSGSIPVVGEPCPGNQGHDGVWTSVTALSSTSGGGLYAVSADAPVGSSPLLIWSAPSL